MKEESIVVVNEKIKLRLISRTAKGQFGLSDSDIGLNLRDLSGMNIEKFETVAAEVLETLQMQEKKRLRLSLFGVILQMQSRVNSLK